jgi:hypothetical protein
VIETASHYLNCRGNLNSSCASWSLEVIHNNKDTTSVFICDNFYYHDSINSANTFCRNCSMTNFMEDGNELRVGRRDELKWEGVLRP